MLALHVHVCVCIELPQIGLPLFRCCCCCCCCCCHYNLFSLQQLNRPVILTSLAGEEGEGEGGVAHLTPVGGGEAAGEDGDTTNSGVTMPTWNGHILVRRRLCGFEVADLSKPGPTYVTCHSIGMYSSLSPAISYREASFIPLRRHPDWGAGTRGQG